MATVVLNRPRPLSAAEVAALANANLLPKLPAEVESFVPSRGRPVEWRDLAVYEWYALGGEPIAGVIAVRAAYDLHTNADTLFVEYLAGSPRAVKELLEFVRAAACERGVRVAGAVDIGNFKMKRFLARVGFRMTRIVFEAG